VVVVVVVAVEVAVAVVVVVVVVIWFLPHIKEILSHARFEVPTTVVLRTQIFYNLTLCCECLCTIGGRKVL